MLWTRYKFCEAAKAENESADKEILAIFCTLMPDNLSYILKNHKVPLRVG